MKIIIASTVVPFVEGGGTFIVDWLELKLKEYGHQAEAIKIPFTSDYTKMISQMLALRLYHLEDACDRLICIRMPSYMIKHPDKYLWFIHHYREMYDLWKTSMDYLPKDDQTLAIREYVMRADTCAFSEAKKIYTNSKIVSKRLKTFNNIESVPLYPPIFDPKQFYCEGYGDYICYASRFCEPKRQHLALEAMKYTKTDVKLEIIGKSDDDAYFEKLVSFIKRNKLEDKARIENRWVSEQEKTGRLAGCLAVLYIPFDEDSYGYPSLEAHHSSKAVISCTDSGGTDELIVNGQNGFLIPPDPKELAAVFDRLYLDRRLAEKMGQAGLARLSELNINWDAVVNSFTGKGAAE